MTVEKLSHISPRKPLTVLFVTKTAVRNNTNLPSLGDWIDTLWYIYKLELSRRVKMNEIDLYMKLIFIYQQWIRLKNILINEKSKFQYGIYSIMPFV